MRTLYLDCQMGAAGDMLTAALLELMPKPDELIKELNNLGIPGVNFQAEPAVKCGITGTHMKVTVNGKEEESLDVHDHIHDHDSHDHKHYHDDDDHHHHHGNHDDHNEHSHDEHSHTHDHDDHTHSYDHDHNHAHNYSHDHDHSYTHDHSHAHDHSHPHHHHSSLHDIEHIVRDHLSLPKKVQDDIMAVYQLIAEAESHAHNAPVTEIHFHEVGTMDAIADVAAVCMLMDRLAPDQVVVSPVHTGSGQVKCAHGILPVPAPATAYILKDVPVYGGNIKGELCTPTGAALLKHFASRFGSMPVMRVQAVGYGMGKKDFEAANCVRAFFGESEDKTDQVLELSCNVDDMTAEAVGFAMERLFDGGALDGYTIPIGMKKSRPGTLIRVMCTEQNKQKMIELLFKHTTTLGVRETQTQRYVLDRTVTSQETPYGPVRCKHSSGYGVTRSKYEYDDLARIAREEGMSIEEVRDAVKKAKG